MLILPRIKVEREGCQRVNCIAGSSGHDLDDVVTGNSAEIDEAFRISFDGLRFLLI